MDWTLRKSKSKAVRLAGSHVITTCATIAAILMFVALGSQVVPAALLGARLPDSASTLKVAFLLNIAIILLLLCCGWNQVEALTTPGNMTYAMMRVGGANGCGCSVDVEV